MLRYFIVPIVVNMSVAMLNVVMLSVLMLTVIMLNAIMLSVVRLNVAASAVAFPLLCKPVYFSERKTKRKEKRFVLISLQLTSVT
jgi:hypothetical protein